MYRDAEEVTAEQVAEVEEELRKLLARTEARAGARRAEGGPAALLALLPVLALAPFAVLGVDDSEGYWHAMSIWDFPSRYPDLFWKALGLTGAAVLGLGLLAAGVVEGMARSRVAQLRRAYGPLPHEGRAVDRLPELRKRLLLLRRRLEHEEAARELSQAGTIR